MGFRERPEYKEWRDAVLELFGRKCIICGHPSNIHVHHVKPVHTYPELTFDPSNGVPLCGNCHSEVNANELEYVEELQERQRAFLNGEVFDAGDEIKLSEEELRGLAVADPADSDAVERYFIEATDAQAVIDFYNAHRTSIPKTAAIYSLLAMKLEELERWDDAIRAVDAATRRSDKEGTNNVWINSLATIKSNALQQRGHPEAAIEFLQGIVSRFPENAYLQYILSTNLIDCVDDRNPQPGLIQEARKHAEAALALAPNEYDYAWLLYYISLVSGDRHARLKNANRALSIAKTNEDKVDALNNIADTFYASDLFVEARKYLRKALKTDDHNIRAIASMAECYIQEDNLPEAVRCAKHGLLIAPNNEACRNALRTCVKIRRAAGFYDGESMAR